jgi:hypothetical protein
MHTWHTPAAGCHQSTHVQLTYVLSAGGSDMSCLVLTFPAVAVVSNHCGWADILIHMSRFFPAFVARDGTQNLPMVGLIRWVGLRCVWACSSIWFERGRCKCVRFWSRMATVCYTCLASCQHLWHVMGLRTCPWSDLSGGWLFACSRAATHDCACGTSKQQHHQH